MAIVQAHYTLGPLRVAAAPNIPKVLSTFSITSTLAIAYLEADGSTMKQMHNLLAEGNW